MKKIISFALIILMTISLISCGPKVGEGEELFTVGNMKIVLPEEFEAVNGSNATAAFQSNDATVVILEEPFSSYDDFTDYTIEEYATVIRFINSKYSPSVIRTVDGVTCFDAAFTTEDTGATYYMMFTMVRSDDAFWLFKFVCDHDAREEYMPLFIEWTKSATFK